MNGQGRGDAEANRRSTILSADHSGAREGCTTTGGASYERRRSAHTVKLQAVLSMARASKSLRCLLRFFALPRCHRCGLAQRSESSAPSATGTGGSVFNIAPDPNRAVDVAVFLQATANTYFQADWEGCQQAAKDAGGTSP